MDSSEFNKPEGTPTDYPLLHQQATLLVSDEPDLIANLANLSALLNEHLHDINWVGFYLTSGAMANELVLGPFQGKVACIRIPFNQGVCGKAARTGQTQVVTDVHAIADHIACDAASNSEIVLPITVHNKVVAVLDIDSPSLGRFNHADQQGLEKLLPLLQNLNWTVADGK